jgi:hypothetical protein
VVAVSDAPSNQPVVVSLTAVRIPVVPLNQAVAASQVAPLSQAVVHPAGVAAVAWPSSVGVAAVAMAHGSMFALDPIVAEAVVVAT